MKLFHWYYYCNSLVGTNGTFTSANIWSTSTYIPDTLFIIITHTKWSLYFIVIRLQCTLYIQYTPISSKDFMNQIENSTAELHCGPHV